MTEVDKLFTKRERMVRAAERASGFKEGRFTLGGLLCEVKVSFYGGEAWWLDVAGQSRQPLTRETWNRLVPYPKAPQ